MGFNLDKNKLLSSIEKGVKNSSDVISDNDIASSVLEESTKPLDNILSSLNYSTGNSEEDNTMLVHDEEDEEDEEDEVWGSNGLEEPIDDFDMSEEDEDNIQGIEEVDEFDMSEEGDEDEVNTLNNDDFDMSEDEDENENDFDMADDEGTTVVDEGTEKYTKQTVEEDNDDFDMSEDEEYTEQRVEENNYDADFDMSEDEDENENDFDMSEDEEYTEQIIEENNNDDDFDMSEDEEYTEQIIEDNSVVHTVDKVKSVETDILPTSIRSRANKGLKNINSTTVNTNRNSSDTEKGKQTLKVEDKVSIIDKGVKETASEATIKGNVNYEKGMLLLEFLRLNPKIRTEKDVLEYFTKEDLKREIVKGKVLVKKGKLII
ncbi:hypothetical protein D3C81_10250 [compost metagenome]